MSEPSPPVITRSRTSTAPPQLVHDLLVDVGAWALWSPHVVSVEVDGAPASGVVHPGWRGRVRPWFGPATTMEVTEVAPGRGMCWRTRALGHELSYAQLVEPDGDPAPDGRRGSRTTFTAAVTGPAGALVQRLAAPLSGAGQAQRLRRLCLLAERVDADRRARPTGATAPTGQEARPC